MKLACFSETTAPPIRVPLSPAASISRPAESPSGLRKTLPADGRPSGWCACRQWRISSRRALIVVRVRLGQPERGVDDHVAWRAIGSEASATLNRLSRYANASSAAGTIRSVPSASRTRAVSRTAATSASWAPAFAQTAPPTVDAHGRQRTVGIGMTGNQQRTRRRQQLHRRTVRIDRHAGQQPRRRRRRHREQPVRALHRAAARVERRGHDPIRTEPLEREDAADDVDDGVERADLVQMDLVHRIS